jgi:DNA polymerase-1
VRRNDQDGGGPPRATTPFRQAWCIDFEFQDNDGDQPLVLCMVAKEFNSGETIRLGRDELLRLKKAPFDTGPDALVVAYLASAEMRCFLALGWPIPHNLLDLYVEHRVQTNGRYLPTGNGLIGALAIRGLVHIEAADKEAMRRLVCDRNSWSASEWQSIVDCCESDVDGLIALLNAMARDIDWDRALLRGRYMAAVARMERTGIPIDTMMHRLFVMEWDRIKTRLVRAIDRHYGVYDGLTFKAGRFSRWLKNHDIPWPRLPSGALDLKDDTFKSQANLWPNLGPLRDLRQSLNRLHLSDLKVGKDKRSRAMLSPFASITGRNQPSASKFAFGPAKWMRGLVKPPEGCGLAYIDFSSQEIGIAAGLSGDELLIDAYRQGDPYLAFAKQAKLAPADATRTTHKVIRDRCKEVVLGVNYGIGAETMALKAGITPAEASELITLHKRTYRDFWAWSDAFVSSAYITNEVQSVFGFKRRVKSTDKATSLMNFPMQANGAEMMRIAAVGATEAGIEVCAPVHDAFLIAAPLERLDEDVAHMRELMSGAGEAVAGINIRTDATIIRYPDRYMDDRGIEMWNRVVELVRH